MLVLWEEYDELRNKHKSISDEHKDLLERGEKAESKAWIISLLLSWLVGLVLNILKVIYFGWNYFSSEHRGDRVFLFLLETVAIFILSWVILYIIIKPFDSLYRNKYRKCITPEEFAVYKKISMDLSQIKSQMNKIEKENKKIEEENSRRNYSCREYGNDGVSDFMKIADEWSDKH